MKLRTFLSVSAHDRTYCQGMLAHAGDAELDVWYDHDSSHDAHFTDLHRQEILNRSVCLIILSPAAFDAPQMRDEHAYIATLARQQPERIVLPIIAQPFAIALLHDWPLRFTYGLPEGQQVHSTSAADGAAWLRTVLNPDDAPPDMKQQTMDEALIQARALLFRGKVSAAQHRVEPWVAREPQSFFPRYCLGLIQLTNEDYDAAQRTFTLVTERDRTSDAAWLKKAEAFYPYRKMAKTMEALDLVAQREPENSFQWQIRGRAWKRNIEWDKALPAYERSLEIEPFSASCWFDTAYALHHARRPEEALVALNRSLAILPTVAGWQWRAHALITLQRYDDAIDAYDQGLALAPTDAAMLEQQALLLAWLGKHEAAIATFDRFLRDDVMANRSSKQDNRYYRGLQLLALQRFDEALAAFDAALDHEMTDEDEEDEIDFSEPVQMAHYVVERGDGEIVRFKALALVTLGRYADALPLYDALLKRIPIDVDLWQRKGMALFLAQQRDEAMQALTYVQTLAPADNDNARMIDVMSRLYETSEDGAAFHQSIVAALTMPYPHSRKLWLYIEEVLEIPDLHESWRTFGDEAMEDIEDRGYGVAHINIDKITYFSDVAEFLTLARRLGTVPGIELTEEQRSPYATANNPISLALFIYYKLLAWTDDTLAIEPLTELCLRYSIDVASYLPKRYRTEKPEGADESLRHDADDEEDDHQDDEENADDEEVDEDLEDRVIDLIERGFTQYEVKDYAGAAALFEQAVRLDPSRGDAFMHLADTYQMLGRDEDALDIYARKLQSNHIYSNIFHQQATIYFRQHRLEEALHAINRAYVLAENEGSYGDPLARSGVLRGQILLALHRGDEALETLDRLVEREPRDYHLLLERGRIKTQMGQWAAAVPDFAATTQLKPDEAYVWHSLAYALNRCDRYAEAFAAIDRALLLSVDAAIIGTKGEIYLRMGNFAEALAWLGRALEKNPNDGEHWYDRAAALRGLGRFEEADDAEQHARRLPDLRPKDRDDTP